MELFTFVRRSAVLLVVVAIAAGCAASPEESGPDDANCDGDRDGIPDGQSPSDGTNTACDDANLTNETEPTMPGVLP